MSDITSNSFEENLKRTLSYILRHGLLKLKLNFDSRGSVLLVDLVNSMIQLQLQSTSKQNISISKEFMMAFIRKEVRVNDKKRFIIELIDGKERIYAFQGHSLTIGERLASHFLERLEKPVDLCLHGTFRRFLPPIMFSGLSRMSRCHIHMASGFPDNKEVISGARKSCEVFIVIDMKKAMDAGIIFFRSNNGVILTEGIKGILPTHFFKEIVFV